MGGGIIDTSGTRVGAAAQDDPTVGEWMARYDAMAGTYAATTGMELRSGFTSVRAAVRRADSRYGAFSVTWTLTGGGVYIEQTSSGADATHPLDGGSLLLRRPDRQGRLTLDACPTQRRWFIDADPRLYPLAALAMPELRSAPTVSRLPRGVLMLERLAAFMDSLERLDPSRPLTRVGALCDVIRSLYRANGIARMPDEPILRAARLLASEPFSVTLPSVADRCGIPYGLFRKRFTAVFGQTPGKWRILRRVERAKQELAAGEQIATVAERLAYSDVYSFSHQFRGVTGMTPKQYQLKNVL
ncbi:MAG: AraC family transcriptional regulator [Oscillospiraceae bacterium]|jgi:AraC-like DNA-binding protein|nr:AraC family transcriptional regulator [Oscillospiraceae bacterium]